MARKIHVRKGRLDDREAQESFDRAFWAAMTGEERVAVMGTLVEDWFRLRGLSPQRLRRVARRVR